MRQRVRKGAWGAVRVVRVDLDGVLPDISGDRGPDCPGYAGARVVAVRGGQPVADFDLDLRPGPVTAAELRGEIARRLGDSSGPAPEPAVLDEQLPRATVVICSTFDRDAPLRRSLASVLDQAYPSFDVVVVDNRPRLAAQHADLRAWLRAQPTVALVDQPRPGLSAARNAGAAAASGEIVAFVDDDVVMESGWLRAIGSRFVRDPETDCVTGPVLPLELEHPAQWWFESSGSKLSHGYRPTTYALAPGARGRRRFVALAHGVGERAAGDEAASEVFIYRGKFGSGANISVRARALREIGGFDEALGTGTPSGGGEDLHLFTQLLYQGRRLTFDPGAAIYHAHRADLDDLRRTMVTYGSGYTAMLAALVRADGRHLVGLAHFGIRAAALLVRRGAMRRDGSYPASLARAERRGLLRGPWAYYRSRRLHSRGHG